MTLEVQAAIANCQRPPTVTNVRDAIVVYIDEFLNEWLAANPSAIRDIRRQASRRSLPVKAGATTSRK